MRREDLDALTARHPECLIAAFADIGSGVTLLTDSKTTAPREVLDELCAEAALTLGSADIPPLGGAPCPLAVKTSEASVFVYLRDPEDPGTALLCMCKKTVALEAFVDAAKEVLGIETEGVNA